MTYKEQLKIILERNLKMWKMNTLPILDSDTLMARLCDVKENSITNFNRIHEDWCTCFVSYLINLDCGYSIESALHLFYFFEMSNFKELHTDLSKKELYEVFIGDCWYISDRMSLDRLFRTHHKFLWCFRDEIYKVKKLSIS